MEVRSLKCSNSQNIFIGQTVNQNLLKYPFYDEKDVYSITDLQRIKLIIFNSFSRRTVKRGVR